MLNVAGVNPAAVAIIAASLISGASAQMEWSWHCYSYWDIAVTAF